MTTAPSRMLTLLSLMQAQHDWPGLVLAQRLGVTTRTIRRDVDRLRSLGYRIDADKGPDGGYRLAAGSALPPLQFDDEQAVAVAVALQGTGSIGVEIDDAAARALATVQQVMPSRLRHRIRGIGFTGEVRPDRVDPGVLEAVSGAVRDGVVLRFDYGEDGGPARRVEPHDLVVRQGRWYLVAWDLERADWRLYRVDRIRPRVPTGPRFEGRAVPTGSAATFVEARAKGAQDENRWPCVGEVEIRLPVRDLLPWLEDAHVEELSETWSRVTTGSWSWAGLVAAILRFDAPFRILGPAELVVAAEAAAVRLSASVSVSHPSVPDRHGTRAPDGVGAD